MFRSFIRSLATLIAALGVAACADSPTAASTGSAGAHRSARIGFNPLFSAAARAAAASLADFGISFDHVRVVLVRPPTDTVKDTTIAFGPGQPDVTLDLDVTVVADGEVFNASIDYLNAGGVLFHGGGPIQSHAPDQPAPTQTITIQYVGPGAAVTRVVISPKTSNVVPPATLPFTATAFDANNAPVTGTPLSWTTSDPSVATISNSGILTTTGRRGTVTVTAATPNNISDNASVTVDLPPTGISLVSGGGQTGKAGATLAQPAVVRVTAVDGVGVAGVSVTFAAPVGGSVGSTRVTTDAGGLASTSLTLGSILGSQNFAAIALGISVAIPATATVGDPASVAMVSGTGQSDTVKHALKLPLTVKVSDQFGNAVPNATVAWTRTAGSGVLSGAASATGPDGLASIGYTLGGTAGTETITASAAGVSAPATFTETAVSGAPSSIAVVSGNGQTARIFQVLAPFVVKVADDGGNPVVGAVVAWVSNNGTLSATTTTDASGQSSNTMTLLGNAGTASAAATVAGKTVGFSVTVQTGVVAKMVFAVGPPASAPAGTAMAPSLQVALEDAGGNPVPGINPITIAIGTNPGGGTLTGTLTRNAVAGIALFNDLKIDKVGAGYTLVASSQGIPSITSAAFTVAPSAPTHLGWFVNPINGSAGIGIVPYIEVSLLDAGNNIASAASNPVTIAITPGTGPIGATLFGSLTVAASGGVATFPGVSVSTSGAGYTLTATSPGLTSAVSTAFSATPGLTASSPLFIDDVFSQVSMIFNGGTFVPGGTTLAATGGSITPVNIVVQDSATLTVDFVLVGGVSTSVSNITVTTALGTSSAFPFTLYSVGSAPVQLGPINGDSGGSPYSLDCPAGAVATGLNVRGGSNVDQLQVICQAVTGSARTFGSPTFTAAVGGSGGSPATLACPANYVLSGLTGRIGNGGAGLNDMIAGICAPINGGATTTTASVGSNFSGSIGYSASCPTGLALTGIQGGAGNLLDRTQIKCQ